MRIRILSLFILFGFILKPFESSAQVDVQDSLVLVNLYDSTNGTNWASNQPQLNGKPWTANSPVSNWYGVTLQNGRVTRLQLGHNGLQGKIPHSIINLSALSFLDLSYNFLNGNMLSTLSNLSNLDTLNLYFNPFSDTIPSSISNLSKLSYLNLSINPGLHGSIPGSFSSLSNLTYLNLEETDFNDTIPAFFGDLTNLRYLNMSFMLPQLTGGIPSSFGKLVSLDSLILASNNLRDTIPSSLQKLSNLTFLNLSSNQFTFASIEDLAKAFNENVINYNFQQSIPLHKHGNILSLSAGGTLVNDTFRLIKNDVLVSTQIGDSTFTINSDGAYWVYVTNAIAKNLEVGTNTLYVGYAPVKLCQSVTGTMFISDSIGSNYQWQLNNGNGFSNIYNGTTYAGVNTDTLRLSNINTSLYGYQYRCVVDGNNSTAFVIQFTNTWTGNIDSIWERPTNWSCGLVPNADTDVIINFGTVVLNSNVTVRSLTVNPNASFTVTAGKNLTVTH